MAKLLLPSACRPSLSALATKRLRNPSPLPVLPVSPSPWFTRSLSAASAATTFDTTAFRSRNCVGFLSRWPNYRSRLVHSHGRVLLCIMLQRDWDAVLEHELAHAGVSLRPDIVDQVIACIPSAKLALQFFIWAGEQIGYPALTSKATYDLVQWYAAKSQLFPFLKILQGLQNPHFGLSPSRVNVLLQGYGWAGMLDRAFSVMLRSHGFSNDVLVKCFLHSIISQYRYDMVHDVYMEMMKLGTRLDLCYNELIQGMALAGDQKCHEADLLYIKVAESGNIIKEETCNALLLSISRAGKHERADALLEDMIKKKIRLANTTVVAVIESLCHAQELHRASRIIDEMKRLGFVLNSKVYKSLLEALGSQRGPQM